MSKMIDESSLFSSPTEAEGFKKGINHAGWVFFMISIVATLFVVSLMVWGGLAFFNNMDEGVFRSMVETYQ